MKRCPRCTQDRPLVDFYGPWKNGRFSFYCKPCFNAMNRITYLKNKTARNRRIVEQRRAGRVGLTYDEYVARDGDPGTACAVCGVGPTHKRNGAFRNASTVEPKSKRLAVDHDHKTGIIRGFLCGHCNRALGLMGDDPALIRRLAAYVESSTSAWEPLTGQRVGAKRRASCSQGHPFSDENVIRLPSGALRCGVCRAEWRSKLALRACDVEGCTRKFYGLGFCRAHWHRFKRYGDPLAGRAENGSSRSRKQHVT